MVPVPMRNKEELFIVGLACATLAKWLNIKFHLVANTARIDNVGIMTWNQGILSLFLTKKNET